MKNKGNALVIVLLAVLIIIGGYFLFSGTPELDYVPDQNVNTPADSTPGATNDSMSGSGTGANANININVVTPKTHTVTYSDTGYSPSSLTINKGDTVRFVNSSSRNVWTASDSHPTHAIYPEFDQDRAVPNGGIYEFTFEKVGSWKYHNHSRAADTGTIIVLEAN